MIMTTMIAVLITPTDMNSKISTASESVRILVLLFDLPQMSC